MSAFKKAWVMFALLLIALLLPTACDYSGSSKAGTWAEGWLTGLQNIADPDYIPVYIPTGPT